MLLPSALRPSAIWRAFGTASVTSSMRKPVGQAQLVERQGGVRQVRDAGAERERQQRRSGAAGIAVQVGGRARPGSDNRASK